MRGQQVSRTKALGDVLDELIHVLGIGKKLREQNVVELWDEAVGDRIAEVARPTRMIRGILFVSVQSGAWRNELNMRKLEILAKLNEIAKESIVMDIKFQ